MAVGQKNDWSETLRIKRSRSCGFRDVDKTSSPFSFVTYLDRANSDRTVRINKQLLFSTMLVPRKGEKILDVGCGVGHDCTILARSVGRNGWVIGIDRSETMIREAKKRAEPLKLPIEFCCGDAHHLEFPDNMFDACLAISTLMYVADSKRVISEMFRVLKPGGRLVALEPDWETLVMTAGHVPHTRTITKVIRQAVPNPGIGHHLPVLFREAGLSHIHVEAGTIMASEYEVADNAWRIGANFQEAQSAGYISSHLASQAMNALKTASNAGVLFIASTGFAVKGQKPIG